MTQLARAFGYWVLPITREDIIRADSFPISPTSRCGGGGSAFIQSTRFRARQEFHHVLFVLRTLPIPHMSLLSAHPTVRAHPFLGRRAFVSALATRRRWSSTRTPLTRFKICTVLKGFTQIVYKSSIRKFRNTRWFRGNFTDWSLLERNGLWSLNGCHCPNLGHLNLNKSNMNRVPKTWRARLFRKYRHHFIIISYIHCIVDWQ